MKIWRVASCAKKHVAVIIPMKWHGRCDSVRVWGLFFDSHLGAFL